MGMSALMSGITRTKFYVVGKESVSNGQGALAGWKVKLSPIWESDAKVDGNAVLENRIFSKFTPQGVIELFLTNPVAAERFEAGREYYVDFSAAHPDKDVKLPNPALA